MRPSYYLCAAIALVAAPVVAEPPRSPIETLIAEWHQCVGRQYSEAVSRINRELAIEFAFAACATEENAIMVGSGMDIPSVVRAIAQEKALIKRRTLTQP